MITTYDQWNSLKDSEKAVAFYCYSNDCPVCRALRPRIEKLFERKFPRLTVRMVDLQQAVDLTERLQIYTIPVLIVCFGGKEHLRKIRCWGMDELEQDLSRPYRLMFGINS